MKLTLTRGAMISSSVSAAFIALQAGSFTAAFTPSVLTHHHHHHHHHHHQSPPPLCHHGHRSHHCSTATRKTTSLCMSEQPPDESGADLASEFFKALSNRNISLEGDEIDFADAEEDELTDLDTGEVAYEGGDNASNELDDDDDAILREYDVSEEGSSTLTDGQIYDEMKERVFESAGAFVELTKGADEGGMGDGEGSGSKVYVPPTNVPDTGLTAGEVVELVLSALQNNDNPSPDYGVQILFGYSSPESQIVEQIETDGLTPSQYRTFLSMMEDNMALFDHHSAIIDKADFSPDRLKGYFTARLMMAGGSSKDDTSVNFILSTTGTNDDDCWMIDSMLIRPSKLRRRRRR